MSPGTDPATNVDYDRAGGNTLEALIAQMDADSARAREILAAL